MLVVLRTGTAPGGKSGLWQRGNADEVDAGSFSSVRSVCEHSGTVLDLSCGLSTRVKFEATWP